jgi:hypothetical protein
MSTGDTEMFGERDFADLPNVPVIEKQVVIVHLEEQVYALRASTVFGYPITLLGGQVLDSHRRVSPLRWGGDEFQFEPPEPVDSEADVRDSGG